MEYFIFLGICGIGLVFIFVKEALDARKKEKEFVTSLYEQYGELPDKEYSLERYAKINSFFRRHKKEDAIDDITWNDLGMDAVFKRMNYTFSATGEEYLYYMLREANKSIEELEHQEQIIQYFEEHADERVRIQYLMHQLGYMKKYSLYDYLDVLDVLGERSNKKHMIANLLFIPLMILAPFELSFALLGIAVLLCYNIVSYFKEKGEIEPYIISFAYIVRLVNVCKKLAGVKVPVCEKEWELIKENTSHLEKLNRDSYFVFSRSQGTTSGNPLDILADYGRMIFHLDLIQFNRMLYLVRKNIAEIDCLIATVGFIESCIAIGGFRASLHNGYCVPVLREGVAEKEATKKETAKNIVTKEVQGIYMQEGYHPLLEAPVKNTIEVLKGVLITGSNASGKSTFLKTVAINAILAQTIHTCTAKAYEAPVFRIFSSMSLKDDLESGESYYMAEIRAIKRILDAKAERGKMPILCFVDEVLRGTNTVERIAASTQILKSLSEDGTLCFAATHDIELTGLLEGSYENYHFEEEVCDGDVKFHYKLLQGKATTRNAIKLLQIMGYKEDIIKEATRRAEYFVQNGVWR